jgi:signal transduction histidine kinase
LALHALILFRAVVNPQEPFTPWAPINAFIALFLLLYLNAGRLQHRLGQWYLPVALFVASAGSIMAQWLDIAWYVNRGLSSELAEKNVELARYATTVEQLTISHECNRMARDLHDTLAHTLSAVAVQLEALNAQFDSDTTGARETLRRTRELTRNGLQEVRRALNALRASPLEDLGLAQAIRHQAEING